jgi:formiminoglutamate deiminase
LLPTGWTENVRLDIAAGHIAVVESAAPPGGEIHDIALPAMPNLHSHAFQRALAGRMEARGTTQDSVWAWRDMVDHAALRLDPDDVEAIATLAFIEMLEGGFGSVAEFHVLHHAPDGRPYDDIAEMAARLAAAAAAAGIFLVLLPVFYAHGGFGGQAPRPAQRRFLNDLATYETLMQRCERLAPLGIALQSLRAVTLPELAALTRLAQNRLVHIPIAEQSAEVEDCLAWSGQRPVDLLFRHANVGANWCLVHATQADTAERQKIAASGAVVGLCPVTEADRGDGVFPAAKFAGAYGIGSDSNLLIGVGDELRMLEYAQRLTARRRNMLANDVHPATVTALYLRALAGGAQALGLSATLEAGAPANIVTLRGDEPDIALARMVFCRGPIDTVWVHGQKRVTGGHHPLAAQARRKFNTVLKKLVS